MAAAMARRMRTWNSGAAASLPGRWLRRGRHLRRWAAGWCRRRRPRLGLSRCCSAFHIGTLDRALGPVPCTVLRSIASSAASLRAKGEILRRLPVVEARTAHRRGLVRRTMPLRGLAGPAAPHPLGSTFCHRSFGCQASAVLRQNGWWRAPCPQGLWRPGCTRSLLDDTRLEDFNINNALSPSPPRR